MTSSEHTYSPAQDSATAPLVPLPWLTGEVVLYSLLILLALGLRFAFLGYYPLHDQEAAQSLVGWDIYQGNVPTTAKDYSPLMASLTSFSFFLFGPSDVTARIGSVLLGVLLILLPLGLRHQLGPLGTLIAASLFTLSASSLYWSRTNSGDMAVAVGTLMLLVGSTHWVERSNRFGLFMLAGGLVMLLISAPAQFTIILILLGLLLFWGLRNPALMSNLRDQLQQARVTMAQAGLFGGGLLILFGTAALFNLTGLATISDMFETWLGQFSLMRQPNAGYPVLLMLIVYEPVILIFGVTAIAFSFVERRSLDQGLVIGFGIFILLDLFMGGRSSGQLLLALIPLTLLASRLLNDLISMLLLTARVEGEGLFVGFGLTLSVFVYISLTSWSKCNPQFAVGCNTAWILPLAGIFLIIVLFGVFWRWYGTMVAWRGLGLLILLVVGAFSINASWRLNYVSLKDLPFQPMVSQVASTRFHTLLEDITRLSTAKHANPAEIDVAIVGLDRPMMRWYLRDFKAAQFMGSLSSALGQTLIVTPAESGPPIANGYVGQDFVLVNHWQPDFVVSKAWLRWYLFRLFPQNQIQSESVILWVREG